MNKIDAMVEMSKQLLVMNFTAVLDLAEFDEWWVELKQPMQMHDGIALLSAVLTWYFVIRMALDNVSQVLNKL